MPHQITIKHIRKQNYCCLDILETGPCQKKAQTVISEGQTWTEHIKTKLSRFEAKKLYLIPKLRLYGFARTDYLWVFTPGGVAVDS